MTQHTTLTVYFEGTANPLSSHVTQIGLFSSITDADDVHLSPASESRSLKISFDGCGVTNGLMGVVFATGLWSQCEEVKECVDERLYRGDHVTVNAVGLSRGGIAVIYLAQLLGRIESTSLKVNLLLFDPVPGNLISASQYLDVFGLSTANSAMDLSRCRNIDSVLALYPYIPLPDLAFHAPVLPTYPPDCYVEEDVVLGCHQGALFCRCFTECILSFVRIHHWLTSKGTKLTSNGLMEISLMASLTQCKDMMSSAVDTLNNSRGKVRHTHSSPAGAVIVQHGEKCRYLNKWHKDLCEELGDSREGFQGKELMLEIVRPQTRNLFSLCYS